MSEEKLLNDLKDYLNYLKGKNLMTSFRFNIVDLLENSISLIEKQLKEIEKLNFENHMVKKWNEQLDRNCISKDKIREIIEHYNNELEHIKNGEEFENEKPMYYWGKVVLEKLL